MSEKVCIIGAGPSGIAAAKVLQQRGIPFDGFEMGSDVGGLWRYNNDNGLSPAYRSLRTNTSAAKTAYSDFPMPADYPDYPRHDQMLAYFERYVDHFNLREHIHFRTKVERVAPLYPVGYDVSARSLESGTVKTARYGSVIVASGHHWNPYLPSFPGTFDGQEMHSQDYRTPDELRGRRVMVVGIGNSACDIVCEVSRVAEKTFLSTRRSAHVIPKHLLGRPLDTWLSPLSARLPLAVRRSLFRILIFLEQGRQTSYGLRLPDHELGSEHPTISTDLLPLIKEGAIIPKPDVAEMSGSRVRFVDGSEEHIDVIIYATGYLVAFPFLEFVDVEDNDLPLFLHVVHPKWPDLYFVGLVQPLGAIPPIAEAQAEWIADLIDGSAQLPSSDIMQKDMAAQERQLRQQYIDSKRHRMEIDFHAYLRQIRQQRARGRKT